MKKPNITEGKWEALSERGSDKQNIFIAYKNHPNIKVIGELNWRPPKENEANARAISAVPEMIDVLIMVYDHILTESSKKGMEGAEDHIVINEIENALQKAGVEL